MKKIIFTLFATAFALSVFASNASDTIIVIENRKIQVSDDENRLRVRVFEIVEEDAVEKRMIFEGHYRDGRVHERRHISITVPEVIPTVNAADRQLRRRRFDPHWAGIGVGFSNFADSEFTINNVEGISLNVSRSREIMFNFFEQGLPLSRNVGFVTGLGMRWNRFHLSENEFFAKENGQTVLLPVEDGYFLRRSRLGVNSLTLPLLFEWQTNKPRGNNLFLSAGVVGVFNYSSTSKIRSTSPTGRRQRDTIDRDLYVRPLTYDFLVQAGFGDFGLFARYSPMGLFQTNRGPAVHPFSLGFLLHFD